MSDSISLNRRGPRRALAKVLFPPLPSQAEVVRMLRSYFAHAKHPTTVHAVLDERGVLRFWSGRAPAAHQWGHAHLWDPFRVVEINAELSQFVAEAA